MKRRTSLILTAAAVAGPLALRWPAAAAQTRFPSQPVRLIIPFAAGGGSAVQMHLLADKLAPDIGQAMFVDPRPGAGGLVATEMLMRAQPDGHTIMMTTNAHTWMPELFKKAWHPLNDITPLAMLGQFPMVILVHKDNAGRWGSLQDLVAYAKTHPGAISCGSSGVGGPQHIAVEEFMRLTATNMVHVPYGGNAPAQQALLGKQIDLMFDTMTLTLPHIRDGRLVALATTGASRHELLPNVPSVRETGVANFSYESFNFVIGPKGMSSELQTFWNQKIAAATRSKEFMNLLSTAGQTVPAQADNTIAALRQKIGSEAETYGSLVKRLNLQTS